MTADLQVQVAEGVATVTVPDFSPLDAYDAEFARALCDAVLDAADSDAVKVIVLRGTGPDFCPETPQAAPPTEVWTSWDQSFAAATALYQSLCFAKKVTIAAVTGHCGAAGSALLLCTDLAVAADGASFRSPFLAHPEANFVLAALTMRLNRAKAWLVNDGVLDCPEALAAGLVNEVCAAMDLDEVVAQRARTATRMPLDGITMSKMLLQAVLDGHGVGREFDQAGFYAAARWGGRP
jgi:enoyl-CoA hydratase/carnithine racemase